MRRWPYILVVDDDADFRTGLRIALEMKGYQVDEAAHGEEALLKLLEKPPLLVLLDLQMPVMNGREMLLAHAATPELKDVPVVIISGFGFEWEAELMGRRGTSESPSKRRSWRRPSPTAPAAAGHFPVSGEAGGEATFLRVRSSARARAIRSLRTSANSCGGESASRATPKQPRVAEHERSPGVRAAG